MKKHNVFCLDHTGHSSRAEWDDTAKADIATGKKVFDDLRAQGFTAFAMPDGDVAEGTRVDRFDPDASVVFVPRLVGG